MAIEFKGIPEWMLQEYANRKGPIDKTKDILGVIDQGIAQRQAIKDRQLDRSLKVAGLAKDIATTQSDLGPEQTNQIYGGIRDQYPELGIQVHPPLLNGENSSEIFNEYTKDPLAFQNKYGSKRADRLATLAKTKETIDAANAKEADAKVPFADVETTFGTAANEKSVGEKLIDDAKASGLDYVPRSKLDLALKGLGVKNSGMRGSAIDSMAETRRMQLRDSLIKEGRASLNPYFQTGAGKEQAGRLMAIGRAEPLVQQMLSQKGGGDKRQMRELATSMDRVIRGAGTSAQTQIEELVPQTARGKFASWAEWFSNDPSGADQQAFIKRYAETLSREKGAIQGQIRSQAEKNAPTLRVLKEHYPDDYESVVNSVLSNPDLVGSNNVPVISDQSGYDALPSGADYKDAQGRLHRKK